MRNADSMRRVDSNPTESKQKAQNDRHFFDDAHLTRLDREHDDRMKNSLQVPHVFCSDFELQNYFSNCKLLRLPVHELFGDWAFQQLVELFNHTFVIRAAKTVS